MSKSRVAGLAADGLLAAAGLTACGGSDTSQPQKKPTSSVIDASLLDGRTLTCDWEHVADPISGTSGSASGEGSR